MKNNKFRTTLLLLVLLLLVGINFTSTITGNIKKINNNLDGIDCNLFSMSSNSLLAYWSFDEGSGSIAYDYSGHDYDGDIHGADWIYGHSGYALDFDGTNDYVSIDFWSEDLGLNKTDDYIISAWFNTTSTKIGKIFEMSDSDGLPMFYIKLHSNGTLEFRAQSTSTCDVTTYSNNSYNDGLWHYIEGIFHGNSSYPILEMYVDGELVGIKTDWLCPQESNQFKRAKIGVTSYDETEFFNGIIDEVKIYKNPEGNHPPNVPTIDGPTTGTIGEEYSYTFLAADSESDDIYYWIDWGDGNNTGWIGPYSSNEEVNVSYTWLENGLFEIRAKTRDIFYDMSEWATLLVAIGNISPDAPTITGPTYGKKGEYNDYNFITTDMNGHDVSFYVDWGDGLNSGWTEYYPSGNEISLSHSWSDPGIYMFRAKAKDIYDSESDWSEQFTVTITEKTLLFGFISNMSSNEDCTTFKVKLLILIGLNPINTKFYSSEETILISNDYIGKITEKYIFGIFNSVVV